MTTAPPPEPRLRVGDAQRRAVDERLQRCVGDGVLTLAEYDERAQQVWAARTQADLDAVVADLPPDPAATATALPGAAPPPVVARRGRAPRRRAVAVLGEHTTTGPVAEGQVSDVVAVLGTARLDLRRTDLPPVVDVRASAVLGTAQVLVPVGVRVQSDGVALLGSREEHLAPGRPDAPLVRLRGTAVLGTVELTHGDDRGRVEAAAPVLHDPRAARRAAKDAAKQQRRLAKRSSGRRRVVRGLVGAALLAGLVSGVASTTVLRGDAASVFGSGTWVVRAGQSDVRVGVLFGSEKVVVLDDRCVVTSGLVLFGSDEGDRSGLACDAAKPPVRVHASGGFGSVEVQRGLQP